MITNSILGIIFISWEMMLIFKINEFERHLEDVNYYTKVFNCWVEEATTKFDLLKEWLK